MGRILGPRSSIRSNRVVCNNDIWDGRIVRLIAGVKGGRTGPQRRLYEVLGRSRDSRTWWSNIYGISWSGSRCSSSKTQ